MCCDPESEIPNGDGKARTKKFRFSCFQSREYLLYQTINQPTSELLPNLLKVIWKSPTSISHKDVHNRLTPARCQARSGQGWDAQSTCHHMWLDSAFFFDTASIELCKQNTVLTWKKHYLLSKNQLGLNQLPLSGMPTFRTDNHGCL